MREYIMYILAIETTGPQLSVALINENSEIVELCSSEKLNHLKSLTPMIAEITKTCGVKLEDASAIAVSIGPGSFTGIRIGVSTARALSQALDKKAIAVPTLLSFAYNVPEYRGVICPIFDARRSQVYAGAYMWNIDSVSDLRGQAEGMDASVDAGMDASSKPLGERISQVVRGAAYDLDEYLSMLDQGLKLYEKDEIMLFGDGIDVYGERIAEWALSKGYCFYDARLLIASVDTNGIPKPVSNLQTASSVSRLALDLYNEGLTVEYGELTPDYMRKAEAERKLEQNR